MAAKKNAKTANKKTSKKVAVAEAPVLEEVKAEVPDVTEAPAAEEEPVKAPEETAAEPVVEAAPVETAEAAPVEVKRRGRKPGSKNKTTKEEGKTGKKKAETTAKSAKKEEVVPEVFLQFSGVEVSEADLIAKVKEQYLAEGHRLGNIKSFKLYLKPEEAAAYYVINEKSTGKVSLQ